LNTNITSVDAGRVVFYNNSASEWQTLTGIDIAQLSNNLVGVISAVTVSGDTLGAQGSGFVTIRGAIQKAGAVAGQVFFVGVSSDLVLTPPVGAPSIRIAYSRQNGFAYVDVDPDTIQIAILQATVVDLQAQITALEEALIPPPVYNFAADDTWGINPEDTNTNFGLDDTWTEGTVDYNANFGADDAWGELIPA
jgi:hypothetical protein